MFKRNKVTNTEFLSEENASPASSTASGEAQFSPHTVFTGRIPRVMNVSSCIENQSCTDQWWSTMRSSERVAALMTVLVISCSGLSINFVILLMFHRQRLVVNSSTNLLLLNLTLSNFIMCLCAGFLLFVSLQGTTLWLMPGHCGVFYSALFGFGSVSVSTRTAIAIERNTTIRLQSNGFVQKQYVTKYLLFVWSMGFLWALTPWLSALMSTSFVTHGPVCAPAPDSFVLPTTFLFFFVVLPVATKAVAYVKVFQSVTIASCKVRYSRSSLMTLAIRVSRASQASGLSHKISQWSTPSVMSNANEQVVRQQSVSSLSGLPAQERRLAFAMFAMVFLSLLTWCPLILAFFLQANRHPIAVRFLTWSLLTSLTCAIHNPLIYVVCNRKFRKVFVSHFLCRCRCHSNAIEAIELQNGNGKASTGRPEPRWLFSGPALATINETGSHIALAGSKHDSDSGYFLNSSSSNLAVVKAPPEEANEQPPVVEPKENFSNLSEKQRQRKRPVVTQDAMLPPVHN